MAHPLKKSDRKREEPKLREPKLVEPDKAPEFTIAQELQGESVADTLIRARQQVGQDLRSIANVLCIRYSYLDAIERGQYENLPGATYAVGFVRTYGEYLGLDGDSVVERFKSEVQGIDNQTKLHFPTPAPEGKMPGGAVFLVAALLFAGAYGVWFYLSNKGESLSDLVAPVPEHLQNLVGGETPGVEGDAGRSAVATPSQTVAPTAPAKAVESAPQVTTQTPPQSVGLTATEPTAAPVPAVSAPAVSAPSVPAVSRQGAEPAETASVAPPAVPQTGGPAESIPRVDAVTQQAVPPVTASTSSGSPVQGAEAPPMIAAPQAAESTNFEIPAGSSVAGSSGAAAPAGSEPLAIPAAPDSTAPAATFLVNHEPKVYGEENSDARIVLKANQDAWVQVRDRQGALLLTRVLRVGDTYRVPNQGELTLLTGNAGGLEISVDGRALAPLGPVGAVRRNIPLDPQSLTSGASQ
ncbi:MAG: DUF4115 domain-containing protein [Roseitalea porphyridii]|uniref:helix-turn-helix domain-containing protein n=1 Tax=Roseitalea porphyridii TaxID=1852022 RepID=UPI0032EF53E8